VNWEDVNQSFSENSESSADDVEGREEPEVGPHEKEWIEGWQHGLRIEGLEQQSAYTYRKEEQPLQDNYDFLATPTYYQPLRTPSIPNLTPRGPVLQPKLNSDIFFLSRPIEPLYLGVPQLSSPSHIYPSPALSTPMSTPSRKQSLKRRSGSFVPTESEESDDGDSFSPSFSTNSIPPRHAAIMSRSKSTPHALSTPLDSDMPVKAPRRRNQQPNKPRRRRRNVAAPGTTSQGGGSIKCPCSEEDGTICGVVFRRLYDLTRHKETIHGETTIPVFLGDEEVKKNEWGCEGCGGFFSRKDALIRHKRVRNCGL